MPSLNFREASVFFISMVMVHGADPTRNGGDRSCDFFGRIKVHIPLEDGHFLPCLLADFLSHPVDAAGNEVRRAVPVRLLENGFPSDTIDVSDRFLAAKIPEFRAADAALPADSVAAFLAVNWDWRARDHARIRELAAAGSPERLWDGLFLQMPNTKNMAGWAEGRTYLHAGKLIDRQTHLGLDLVSTAGAPVPAANAGLVAFTGELAIYGQTVILDHGQGLFTLYAHLGGIGVEKGQRVARGERVGASGQTGMAGGDHLHFAVLVSGVFVNPEEWYDGHWIADNVANKLALLGGEPAAATVH